MKQKRLKLYALANEFTLPGDDKPIYVAIRFILWPFCNHRLSAWTPTGQRTCSRCAAELAMRGSETLKIPLYEL